MNATPLHISCHGFTLEAVLHTPHGAGPFAAVVVCHPHPQYGGDMDNNVVMAVAEGLLAVGIAAVRFNFRGVGRSGGQYGGGTDERDDVTAALRCAAARPELDRARLALAGYSFGASVAAAAVDADVRALALVAPPLRTNDELRARLAALSLPMLVVAGSNDQACPPDRLAEVATLPSAEVRVVQGADHFWWGHEGAVAEAVGAFCRNHLSSAKA